MMPEIYRSGGGIATGNWPAAEGPALLVRWKAEDWTTRAKTTLAASSRT